MDPIRKIKLQSSCPQALTSLIFTGQDLLGRIGGEIESVSKFISISNLESNDEGFSSQ